MIFCVKSKRLAGTDYHEVYTNAVRCYKQAKAKSKRRPYIRSAYFKGSKIFLELFWQHLKQKQRRDRMRRIKYLPCALELMQHSKFDPISRQNPNRTSEILHRFEGVTSDKYLFFVQIKEDKRTGQKWFISVFPKEDK
ncbi:MAG: hypothetical protein V1908_01055 [Candidatus Peregrinibacteria bacterium]